MPTFFSGAGASWDRLRFMAKMFQAKQALAALQAKANSQKAAFFQGFFKTGPGEYGEGDVFIGLSVPQTRDIAQEFHELPLTEIRKLLASPIHEARLLALIILVRQFEKARKLPELRKEIAEFFLNNRTRVNNWDLVDSSAFQILGTHLLETGKSRAVLRKLAKSKSLWDRRIGIMASFAFMRVAKPPQFERKTEKT